MKNEIVTSGPEFDFLLKTDCGDMSGVATFIGDIFNEAEEYKWRFEEAGIELPPLAEIIPTKAMLLEAAYGWFSQKYFELLRNGHKKDTWESNFVLGELEGCETEEELDEAIDEIMTHFNFVIDDNPVQHYQEDEDHPAINYLREVMQGFILYHISYLDDGCQNNLVLENFSIKDWVNPPIVKVW